MSNTDGRTLVKNLCRIPEEEVTSFLAERHPCILSISRKEKGPIATPVWYEYRDGKFRVGMDPESPKAKLLVRQGRATITVQREVEPYKYVWVEGEARFLPDAELATRGDTVWSVMRRIFDRYLDGDLPARYEKVLPILSPTYQIMELTPASIHGESIPLHKDAIPKAGDIAKLEEAMKQGKSVEEAMAMLWAPDA